MSWSVTINSLQEYDGYPEEMLQDMGNVHPKYPEDMQATLALARESGLKSAVLAGGRTLNPYGDGESVNISIVGYTAEEHLSGVMSDAVLAVAGPGTYAYEERHAIGVLGDSRCSNHAFQFNEVAGHEQCVVCDVHLLNGHLHLADHCDRME